MLDPKATVNESDGLRKETCGKSRDPYRLMTMSPLYPLGQHCSTGIHNETVKELTLFSAFINDGITASNLESRGNVIISLIESKILSYLP